jgi:energy-coupling factor transporter ATP-binding protein EcfA2
MERLAGRPLLDTRADTELFVDRDVMSTLLRSAQRGLNVLLLGERGSGKTTLLRRLAYRLREGDGRIEPVFVDGSLARDERTFLDLVRYRLGLQPTAIATPSGLQDPIQILNLVRGLAEGAGEAGKVILVDHLPSASVAHSLFGRLRDELWQLPFTWIVAADESERGGYLVPPADAFFDVVLELPPLTQEEQREFLEKRMGADNPEAVDALVSLNEGNPRRLLGLGREVVERKVDPGRLLHALSDRDDRVSSLGRSATMLVGEMESLGPVSASDDRLLDHLGWTRERAVQVLRRLEDAGIVASSHVKGPSGRPRKVYHLRDVSPR